MMNKLKYRFDNLMARGTGTLIVSLATVTVLMILIVSFIVCITGIDNGAGFVSLIWMGVLHSIDPGAIGGDTGNFFFVAAMFVISLGGIFIFSILIGLLTTGISSKLESLRKGHSSIVESGHTVILGWSNQIFTILSELIEANCNHKNRCIVIMSPMDKVEMDEAIRTRIPDAKTTCIVTRNGSPIDINDLELLSLHTAKSIIINEIDDASVIKTLLAIVHSPIERKTPYQIVAVLREPKNVKVAEIAARGQAQIILEDTIISRIIAQTCRQAGLSAVYTELLNFDRDEIYLRSFPELSGKTYGETLSLFETSSVIGLNSNRGAKLNPPMDTILSEGDAIIAVTRDDDTLLLDGTPFFIDESMLSDPIAENAAPERILILGWNDDANMIIHELDRYVADGSKFTIVSECPDAASTIHRLDGQLEHAVIELIERNITQRATLDALLAEDYPHIILLSDHCHEDIQRADADTIITLLHLRNIAQVSGKQFTIVSEMLDVRNSRLADVAKVNDFIVSDTIISLLMSQVSENPVLNAVFKDIFDADGSEIYLKPVEQYVRIGEPVTFYTVVESARRKGESAFGYTIAKQSCDAQAYDGVYVNPTKSKPIRFEQGDRIIVVAEN